MDQSLGRGCRASGYGDDEPRCHAAEIERRIADYAAQVAAVTGRTRTKEGQWDDLERFEGLFGDTLPGLEARPWAPEPEPDAEDEYAAAEAEEMRRYAKLKRVKARQPRKPEQREEVA